MEPLTIGAIASGAGIAMVNDSAKEIVKTFISPKLAQMANYFGKSKVINTHMIENAFEEYFSRGLEKHKYLNTLVFPNQKKELDSLFVPINLKREPDNAIFQINDNPSDEFVGLNRRTLIKDTAGMGKTTLMKKMYLNVVRQKIGLPIFIEMRKLEKNKTIMDLLFNELTAIDGTIDSDFVMELLKRGDFIFFLDALDEIQVDYRDVILSDVNTFISKANNNTYILSSRPEDILSSFSSFQGYTVQPLTPEEAYELILKYDNRQDLGSRLVQDLKSNNDESLKGFLRNPLLISLLYKAYTYKQDIPLRKHIFYSQVFEALYNAHDLSKDGYKRPNKSGLDMHDFQRVLRVFGYATYWMGLVEFDREKVLDILDKTKDQVPGVSYKPMDLFVDLIRNVPLLKKDGLSYQWMHKSIQEFFAAQYICYELEEGMTETSKMVSADAPRHGNLLELCRSIDYKHFRRHFLLPNYQELFDEINRIIEKNNSLKHNFNFAAAAALVSAVITFADPKESENIKKNGHYSHQRFKELQKIGLDLCVFSEAQEAGMHWTRTQVGPLDVIFEIRALASSKFRLFELDKAIFCNIPITVNTPEQTATAFLEAVKPESLPIGYSKSNIGTLQANGSIEPIYKILESTRIRPLVDYSKLENEILSIKSEMKTSINSIFGFSTGQQISS